MAAAVAATCCSCRCSCSSLRRCSRRCSSAASTAAALCLRPSILASLRVERDGGNGSECVVAVVVGGPPSLVHTPMRFYPSVPPLPHPLAPHRPSGLRLTPPPASSLHLSCTSRSRLSNCAARRWRCRRSSATRAVAASAAACAAAGAGAGAAGLSSGQEGQERRRRQGPGLLLHLQGGAHGMQRGSAQEGSGALVKRAAAGGAQHGGRLLLLLLGRPVRVGGVPSQQSGQVWQVQHAIRPELPAVAAGTPPSRDPDDDELESVAAWGNGDGSFPAVALVPRQRRCGRHIPAAQLRAAAHYPQVLSVRQAALGDGEGDDDSGAGCGCAARRTGGRRGTPLVCGCLLWYTGRRQAEEEPLPLVWARGDACGAGWGRGRAPLEQGRRRGSCSASQLTSIHS